MLELKIESKIISGAVLVRLRGHLDKSSCLDLEITLAGYFARGVYEIVVEMSEVDYISSAGARVFVDALLETQRHNGMLVLLDPSRNVREALQIMGLARILNVI